MANYIQQSGTITPSNIPVWVAPGVLSDGGSAGQYAPSNSLLTIAQGSISLYVIPRVAFFFIGAPVAIAYSNDTTKYMSGTITSYDPTTGFMTVSVVATKGTGTYNQWFVSLSNAYILDLCEALIQAAASGAGTAVFANVATVRALTGVAFPVISIEGWYTAGDNGGGFFVYVSSDTTSSDNGGTILVDASGNRYYRIMTGDELTPIMFGAKGNGSNDDTTFLQSAITNVPFTLSGLGKTYKITAPLTGRGNFEFKDATIYASGLASSISVISFDGSALTPVALTSNTSVGTTTVNVASGSTFTQYGWAMLASTATWSAADSVTYGEYVQIQSISGNTLTLAQGTLLTYKTSDTATIAPINSMSNIKLDRVMCYPNAVGTNQTFAKFLYCLNVDVSNCFTQDFQYQHYDVISCVNTRISDCHMSRSGSYVGLNYGVTFANACYNGWVTRCVGNSLRHLSTVGGSSGVSRFISIRDNRAYDMNDAGYDSHAACYEIEFVGNLAEFTNPTDTSCDGIICQGAKPLIQGNIIKGCRRHGVFWQPLIDTSFGGIVSAEISNNLLSCNQLGGTTGIGVLVQTSTGYGDVTSVDISRNTTTGFDGLAQVIATGGAIRDVSIDGNITTSQTDSYGVYVRANTNNVTNLTITNNRVWGSNAVNYAIAAFGGTTYSVSKATISNNQTVGCGYGLYLSYVNDVQTSGNFIFNTNTAPRNVSNVTDYMAYDLLTAGDVGDFTQSASVASNSVSIDYNFRKVLSIAGTSGYTLNNIGGGYNGMSIVVCNASSSATTTIGATGNIYCVSGGVTIAGNTDPLALVNVSGNWYETGFSNNRS